MGQINENAAEAWIKQNRKYTSLKMDNVLLDYFKMVMDFDMKVRNTKKSQLMNLNMS
jgi:hypothetical protein